jgi:hypothetical protein
MPGETIALLFKPTTGGPIMSKPSKTPEGTQKPERRFTLRRRDILVLKSSVRAGSVVNDTMMPSDEDGETW